MAFRSASAVTNLNGSNDVSLPTPAGIQSGDTIVLVFAILYSATTTAPVAPSGFTLRWSRPQGVYSSGLYVYTKAADAEPASYTVNQGFANGNGSGKVVALTYSGLDNASLIVEASSQTPSSQNGVKTINLPTLSATDAGQDYFAFAFEYNGRNQALSAGSGVTLRSSSGANGLTFGVADCTSAAAGGISGRTLTTTVGGDYLSGALLFAKAAGGTNGTASGTPDSLDLIAPTATGNGTGSGTTNGSASGTPSSASLSAPSATGTGTTAGNGTITTPSLKNNTGTVLASISGWTVNVYNASTGALVVQKTGLATNASGILTITDAAIVSGTSYTYEPVHATYGRRLPTGTAS